MRSADPTHDHCYANRFTGRFSTFWSAYTCAWGHLYESVKTGTPGFVLAHGIPTYDFLEAHPELAACFNRWMSKQSAQQNSAIVDAYDFSKFQVVADIGGGQGSTLAAVLERYPSLRGILFDRSSVVAEPAALDANGVRARCAVVGGDMPGRYGGLRNRSSLGA